MNKPVALIAIALVLPGVASAQGRGRGHERDQQRQRSEQQSRRDEDRVRQREAQDRRQQVVRDAWIPPRPSMWRPSREDRERERTFEAPHVQRDRNRWVMPRYTREDFRVARAFEHGRFTRGTGPSYVWQLRGGNPNHFSISGVWFTLLPADYRWADDWMWDRDYIVVYNDPDHWGWYLAYNVRLGMYLHVRYMGYY